MAFAVDPKKKTTIDRSKEYTISFKGQSSHSIPWYRLRVSVMPPFMSSLIIYNVIENRIYQGRHF